MQHLKQELHFYNLPVALWSELLRRGTQCCLHGATLGGAERSVLSDMWLGLEIFRSQLL